MSKLMTPLMQSYGSSFKLQIKPGPYLNARLSDEPKSPRGNSEKKQNSRKTNRKFSVYSFVKDNTYHKLIDSVVARNINTLTNLKSENYDFDQNDGIVVHFLII